MTIREKLTQEIQHTPDSILKPILDLLIQLKSPQNQLRSLSSEVTESRESLFPIETLNDRVISSRPIWELFEEVADNLPDEVVAELPKDGSTQHDHYLYGSPKQ
jgi:hypothetical protein